MEETVTLGTIKIRHKTGKKSSAFHLSETYGDPSYFIVLDEDEAVQLRDYLLSKFPVQQA